MVRIPIIVGDLVKADAKYIAHQCNAVSNEGAGLAKKIFATFPYSDIYSGRVSTHVGTDFRPSAEGFPGNIFIKGDGKQNRFIINMIAQYFPGRPKYLDSSLDGFKAREGYFNTCLKKILAIEKIESIAFPWKIGCGMAGGDWDDYHRMINHFADELHRTQNGKVFLYRLDGIY